MADDKPKTTVEAPEVKQPEQAAAPEQPIQATSGKTAPAVGDKPLEVPEAGQPTPDKAPNVTVYKMEDIKAQREAAAKADKAAPTEDTRQEWEKPLAEVEAEKQAKKRPGRPPKADKAKSPEPAKPKTPQAQGKAVKAAEQASAPKAKGAKVPKTAEQAATKAKGPKAPKAAEQTAPPADEASMAEKKQKLEQELREKYGIPKTDKPVEPWVAPEVETVVRIPHEKLHAFKDHPFNVEKNTKFMAFVASIRAQGVTQPVIVRPDGKDGYEIISGHRRDAGSIEAEIPFTPCIVRALNDDQAIQQMVEDNVNNREVSTMELARALKMQLESIKHQGAREALDGQDFTADVDKRSNEVIAARNGMSVKQVQRHIALTRLVQPLQDLVDGKVMGGDGKPMKIAFTPAVELSGIQPENQNYIALAIEAQQASPSLSQSQRMRELDKAGKLNGDVIDGIMCEEKKEVDKVIISGAELSNYFGKEKTPQEMKAQIIKLLDDWKGKEKEQAAPEKKAQKEK